MWECNLSVGNIVCEHCCCGGGGGWAVVVSLAVWRWNTCCECVCVCVWGGGGCCVPSSVAVEHLL